jgi:hypothetical protein
MIGHQKSMFSFIDTLYQEFPGHKNPIRTVSELVDIADYEIFSGRKIVKITSTLSARE